MPLRVVAGPGAQGRPFKLVKSTQTGKIDAETASNTVTTENNPCRCHGKRVISAPSKPLKLKLAGHILKGETRLRTKGVCSAPLRSRDIRDKVRNGILTLFRDQLYYSATKQRRTKSFGTHVHNTSNNTSTKLQLQRIKLHIEIINLKPVTPTTILLQGTWEK